jgi:hypothetical protein
VRVPLDMGYGEHRMLLAKSTTGTKDAQSPAEMWSEVGFLSTEAARIRILWNSPTVSASEQKVQFIFDFSQAARDLSDESLVEERLTVRTGAITTLEYRIMNNAISEKPNIKAKDNPWYLLATLYGQPTRDDQYLQIRNRTAWNRYMATTVTDDQRASLIENGHLSTENLFSNGACRPVLIGMLL